MTRRSAPSTPAAFRRVVEAGIRRQGCRVVEWTECLRVEWPTGLRGFHGEVVVADAEGRRARAFANLAGSSLEVRQSGAAA